VVFVNVCPQNVTKKMEYLKILILVWGYASTREMHHKLGLVVQRFSTKYPLLTVQMALLSSGLEAVFGR
jgi:hypothetical protein